MQENLNNTPIGQGEEEGIDIMALIKSLWDGRKTVIICTVIFMLLGLVAAITMKKEYSVSTVMVPQLNSKSSSSSLSSLASLAGFDLSSMSSSAELSPLIYPQIVSSVPFRLEMMHTPLHYSKCDTMISMIDYSEAGYEKPSIFGVVKKYTLGLPGVIMKAIRGEQPEVVLEDDGNDAEGVAKPLVVTVKEHEMLEHFGEVMSLAVDKKEGYITLSVKGCEPIQTAELAMKAQQKLQDEVTRFRIEKSESELEYIQARYDEVKLENDRYQEQLATLKDRSKNVATTRASIELERVQAKYNVASSIYNEMAKQLEQAKMQVKKDTPVFTVIQPVTVPMKSANSRAKTLIVWTFFGVILGCGIVLGKNYWPKVKEMFG
jgi:hypothetical protein